MANKKKELEAPPAEIAEAPVAKLESKIVAPLQEQISEENKAHLKFTLEWLHYLQKGSRSVEFRRNAKAAASSLSKLL